MAKKAKGIEQVDLDDFSGGVGYGKYAATDFTERQWGQIEGFILENPEQIRSQWGIQQVSASTDLIWAVQYVGRTKRYIIAMTTLGQVKYMIQPPSQDSAATTKAKVWTNLGTAIDPKLRPLCVIPVHRDDTNGWRGGVLLNAININGSTDANYVVTQSLTDETLEFITYTSHYPNLTGEVPTSDHMPLAKVGTMWNDFLVLGNVEYYKDPAGTLDYTNRMRYKNGMWISQGGDPTAYHPQDIIVLSDPELRINQLVPIDEGLLIFTDAGPSNNGGVFILRGNPGDDDFELEALRMGMGVEGNADYWPESGAVGYLTSSGEVWHTDGREFARIDSDHFGLPRTVDSRDFVSAYNSWLVVCKQGQMFCFAAFEDDGAWATLIAPESGYALWRHHAGQSLYMVMEVIDGDDEGVLYRFNQYVDENAPSTSERGQIDGVDQTLTVATRTLDSGPHERTHWHRAGVRGRNRTRGTVLDITLYDGPATDADSNSLLRDLTSMVMDSRFALWVRAHGPTKEASAKLRFKGDIEIESVTLTHHRGHTGR